MVAVVSFVDEGLGHSSYLVDLGDGVALVVDPPRFTDEHRAAAADRGARIAFTADTHSHADYVSGSPALAADGAEFLASHDAALEVEHRGVRAGETVELSARCSLRAIATPGHTPDHLAYLLECDGEPIGLFSGGSLMVGTLGRTDLLGAEQTVPLARRLFRSLRADILTLPDELAVYPTHGAGSFCSAAGASERTTTIGRERAGNPLLAIDDEDAFVEELLEGFGTFPPNFRRLPEINRRGPRQYEAIPALSRLGVDEIRQQLESGARLIDARGVKAFAAAHIPGALSIALRPVFSSWLAWLVDPDQPLLFVLDDHQDRGDLVRQCLDVGYERLVGELDGGIGAWRAAGLALAQTPITNAEDVSGAIVDVRQCDEFASGHVPGARNVELGSISSEAVAPGGLTLMCGHGERAMTAASMLEANGRDDVSVLLGGPGDWAGATGRELQAGA